MHFAMITGDSSDKVKVKTVEEFHVWLENAYDASKMAIPKRKGK